MQIQQVIFASALCQPNMAMEDARCLKIIVPIASWDSLRSNGTTQEYLNNSKHVPSGYVKIAIENGHRNSGFSH